MRMILAAILILTSISFRAFAAEGVAETIRVPVLDGVYSVEAPEEWHLEISGEDFTATFKERPDGDAALVIAPPNPVVDDIAEFTKMAVQGVFNAFDSGEFKDEDDKNIGKFPAYATTFTFKVGDAEFSGWARTIDFDGFAVQTMAASKNPAFMEAALQIADSYVLDMDEADLLMPQLKRLGRRAYDEIEKNAQKPEKEKADEKKDDPKSDDKSGEKEKAEPEEKTDGEKDEDPASEKEEKK